MSKQDAVRRSCFRHLATTGGWGLALLCLITNQLKGYPFQVVLPSGVGVTGAILADQVKSLDGRVRRAELIGTLPAETVVQVLAKLTAILSNPT